MTDPDEETSVPLAPAVVRPPALKPTELTELAPAVVRPPPLLSATLPKPSAQPAPEAAEASRAGPPAGEDAVLLTPAGLERLDRLARLTGDALAAHVQLVRLLQEHLPDGRATGPAPAPQPPPAPQQRSSPAGPPRTGPAVLVVDEAATVRDLARSILERAGCVVRTAGDAPEALALMGDQRPDLVITDLEGPQLDGVGLIRTLRATPGWAGLPVLVVTSCAREEDRNRGLRAGADAFLLKQELDETRLLTAVRGLLVTA